MGHTYCKAGGGMIVEQKGFLSGYHELTNVVEDDRLRDGRMISDEAQQTGQQLLRIGESRHLAGCLCPTVDSNGCVKMKILCLTLTNWFTTAVFLGLRLYYHHFKIKDNTKCISNGDKQFVDCLLYVYVMLKKGKCIFTKSVIMSGGYLPIDKYKMMQ